MELAEAVLLQEVDDRRASDAGPALNDYFLGCVQLAHSLENLTLRHENGSQVTQVGDLPFMGLANVQDHRLLASLQPSLQFARNHLGHAGKNRSVHPGCIQAVVMGWNTTKLLVVNKLCNGWVLATDRAIGVLSERRK